MEEMLCIAYTCICKSSLEVNTFMLIVLPLTGYKSADIILLLLQTKGQSHGLKNPKHSHQRLVLFVIFMFENSESLT